jgi:GNAT superfamily N-acetyltransferase
MCSPSELKAKPSPEPAFRITKSSLPRWRINRFFYEYVGAKWEWTDKSAWSEEQWRAYVERDELHTYLAYLHDTPVGYFELEARSEEVDIAMFGLEPRSTGKGLGGHFLSEAIRHAWSLAPKRVTVNTCSLDHPHALGNYLARGMRIFQEEEKRAKRP